MKTHREETSVQEKEESDKVQDILPKPERVQESVKNLYPKNQEDFQPKSKKTTVWQHHYEQNVGIIQRRPQSICEKNASTSHSLKYF